MLRGRSRAGHTLHRGGPGADDPDPLAGQTVQAALAATPGVVIIPDGWCETCNPVAADARNSWQVRAVQRAARECHEASPDRVVAVGGDDPPHIGLVPADLADLGLEAGVLIEVVVPCDRLEIRQDLRSRRVLLGWNVTRLLEQR